MTVRKMLMIENVSVRRERTNVEEKIIRISSMNLSLTLDKNEK